MAEGQPRNRGNYSGGGGRESRGGFSGRQNSRGPRGPQTGQRRTNQQPQFNIFGGIEYEYEPIPFYPERNSNLKEVSRILTGEFRRNLGFGTESVTIEPNKLKLHIEPSGEVVRNPSVRVEELLGREELGEESIVVNEAGKNKLKIDATFSPDVATTLVIDLGKDEKGNDRGQMAGAFRRADLEGVRGESGPTALLDDMPHKKIPQAVNEECLIIGKRGKEEVIIAVATPDESVEAIESRLSNMKRRIAARRLAAVQAAITKGGATSKAAAEAASDIMKYRPVVILQPKSLPKELEESMQTIETEFNGDSDKVKGFAHVDIASRVVTIARPIYLDPSSKGIDPLTIRVVDGTENERDFRWVRGDERSLSLEMRQMTRHLRGPKPIQAQPRGNLIPQPSLAARLLLQPYSVPQVRKVVN
jgi:hypothetical protein